MSITATDMLLHVMALFLSLKGGKSHSFRKKILSWWIFFL